VLKITQKKSKSALLLRFAGVRNLRRRAKSAGIAPEEVPGGYKKSDPCGHMGHYGGCEDL